MENETRAGQYFNLQVEEGVKRSSLEEAIADIMGFDQDKQWPFEEYIFDWYDYSFEIVDAQDEVEFTPEQLEKFWELGFHRCWINYIRKTPDEEKRERYYERPSLPKAIHGREPQNMKEQRLLKAIFGRKRSS